MSAAALWILSLLIYLAPPERVAAIRPLPGWAENAEQRALRYRSISEDIAAVTSDAREQALLVAIAHHESAFAVDVDKGPCYRGPRGDWSRCDGGRAVSIWQIQAVGTDARELFADRRKAAARALEAIRRSARACAAKHGQEAALRVYASGSCLRGIEESSAMVRSALRLLRDRPPPSLTP